MKTLIYCCHAECIDGRPHKQSIQIMVTGAEESHAERVAHDAAIEVMHSVGLAEDYELTEVHLIMEME